MNSVTDSLPPSVINLDRIIGQRADGIVGIAFMKKYVMEVNYKNSFFVFHKPGHEIPAGFIELPIKTGGENLDFAYLDVDFNFFEDFTVRKKVIVDLGAGRNDISWGAYAVNQHQLLDSIKNKTKDDSGKYITGEKVTGYNTRIKSDSIQKSV